MKYKELVNSSKEELTAQLKTEKENLKRLKFAHAITPVENPMTITQKRKDVARILTAINSK